MIGDPSLTLLGIRVLQRIGRLQANNCVCLLWGKTGKTRNVSMSLSPQNVSQKLKKKSSPLLCRICGKPVPIETSKTDEGGMAIHEECYVLKLKLEQASEDGDRL